MSHISKALVAGFALLLLSLPAFAASEPAPVSLSKKDRLQILSEIADIIEDHYLDTEKAAEVSRVLRTRQTRKHLAFDTPVTFAREATALLYELGGDRHLSLKWAPGVPDASGAPRAPSQDHGIRGVEVLPGNVGLLTLNRFYDSLEARESLTAALLILRRTDALIFDLRANRGGTSDTVRLLQSCFFPEPTLVMYYEDEPGMRKASLSEAPPADISCRDKPFYMLTSDKTASAAEDFIYTARLHGHGTIVGENTSGAANFIKHHYLTSGPAPGFRLAVSVGRPVHPETGTNWEGEGIAPDAPISAEQALDLAYDSALETLLAAAPGSHSGSLRYHHNGAHGALHPVHLTNGALRTFASRYDALKIELSIDGLMLRSPAGILSGLTPIGPQIFALHNDTAAQVLFHRHEIGITYVELLYRDGTAEFFGRPDIQ